jgi:hypothetical protein
VLRKGKQEQMADRLEDMAQAPDTMTLRLAEAMDTIKAEVGELDVQLLEHLRVLDCTIQNNFPDWGKEGTQVAKVKTANWPIMSLRRVLGMKARKPSSFNICVAGHLADKKYATPAKGTGGRNDERIRSAFASAAAQCAGKRAPRRRTRQTTAAAEYDY